MEVMGSTPLVTLSPAAQRPSRERQSASLKARPLGRSPIGVNVGWPRADEVSAAAASTGTSRSMSPSVPRWTWNSEAIGGQVHLPLLAALGQEPDTGPRQLRARLEINGSLHVVPPEGNGEPLA